MGLSDWFRRADAPVTMPEVDIPPNLEQIFDDARRAAAGEGPRPPSTPPGRHVIVVTPGRMLMFHPCPPAGSMPAPQVASIEKMIPSATKRKIAAIAHTELGALQKDIARAIPFLGILMGFAYVGHSAWVFEGHPSAMAAGCRDADVLIVDGAMLPHLAADWKAAALGVMRTKEIYVHDRAAFSLRKA